MFDVEITGLAELVAACQRAGNPNVLVGQHGKVSRELDRAAKDRANSRQMRRSVMSNRVRILRSGPQITVGGGGGDGRWAVGAQYGARFYRQFPGAREGGYTVGPAIDDQLDAIADIYADAVLDQF